MERNNPSDVLADAFAEILDLQAAWSSLNTSEMQRRGELVRHAVPNAFRDLLRKDPPRFDWSVERKDGSGSKTRVPWARIFSATASPAATEGWYVVCLFAFDGSAVHLSLNQGTTVPATFRQRSPDDLALRVRAARAVLTESDADLQGLVQAIDLADAGVLGKGYERGNVYAIRYGRNELGRIRSQLPEDLSKMTGLLDILYRSDVVSAGSDSETQADGQRPPLSDEPALVEWIRRSYQPETLVQSRANAEQAAREMLDRFAVR